MCRGRRNPSRPFAWARTTFRMGPHDLSHSRLRQFVRRAVAFGACPFEFIAKVRQLGEGNKYGVLWRVKKCKSAVIGAGAGAGAGCVFVAMLQCCNVALSTCRSAEAL